uniref:receptor-like protein EIX2 n=1 Tax=Erigeron canadensis TaxID=72917 RepID=UPI001CB8F231|nr:receptor-like protein EIX2 [Erigeron canadensis]
METTFHFSFILLFLFVQTYGASSSNTMITASSNVTCIQRERQSLSVIRQGLLDESNQLSTWTGLECCEWWGVGCDRRTGHVVELDLRSTSSFWHGGKVSPFLLNLTHLRYLDLSMNYVFGQNIPGFFGSFKYLEYLDLSDSGFSGAVPPHLGNLSRLQSLDLSNNFDLMLNNDMLWVSLLSSLKHLDLSWITIGNHIDWLHPVNMLPSLLTLNLRSCDINIASIKVINFTSLNSLDLSLNDLNSTIPVWLSNLTRLKDLHLSENSFHGGIPDSIGNLSSLSTIDLSFNQLSGRIPPSLGGLSSLRYLYLEFTELNGSIPESIGLLTSLQELYLGNNKLSGSIPTSIGQLSNLYSLVLPRNQLNGSIPNSLGQLSNLRYLDLSWNQLSGVVSEIHFAKLYNLTKLALSGNSLITLNMSRHWIPPFQLEYLDLSSSWNMGPQFPNWLQTQTHLLILDLSNSRIRDTIPEWFHNISSHLQELDLSDNEIGGNLPLINTNNTGNNGLCGKPLPRNCKESNLLYTHVGDGESKDSLHGLSWFYTGMVSGFVIGFMGLTGSLHFIRIWRITYFEMIENVCSWLTISILVTLSRIKRKSF